MAFLKQNNTRAKENDNAFGPIPAGEYELLVTEAKHRNGHKNNGTEGTPNINITFTVRSDVDQAAKGRKLFHTFWISNKSEASLEACLNMIESFGHKVGVPDGVEFDTPQQWADFIVGKPVKAKVIIGEYNGNENNEIKYFNASDFSEVKQQETRGQAAGTELPAAGQADTDPFSNPNGTIDISDDDLPF
jgi:hypothetical protein